MGLLDEILGREAIKKQLSEKNDQIARAESEIAELKTSLAASENRLVRLQDDLSGREESIASLNTALEETKLESSRLATDLEEFGRVSLEKATQTARALSALENSLAALNSEAMAAKAERDAIAKELQEVRTAYEEKDRLYQERETRLSDESEKLSQEQRKFQQQLAELRSREQHWKLNVKPRIQEYHSHLSLDAKEKSLSAREAEVAERNRVLADLKNDLDSASAQLGRQKTEQEARTRKLEDWARELFAFRNRVDRIDGEVEKLEARRKEIEARNKDFQSQLANLQLERSELRQLTNELNRRELRLKAREESIKKSEVPLVDARNKNVELKGELRLLASTVESLEEKNRRTLSQYQRLARRCETKQSSYGTALSNPKVLSWLLEDGGPEVASIESGWLGSTGYGPWDEQLLEAGLEESEYQFYAMPDADLEYIIVGRRGWSKTDLLAQIEAREGSPLRIYSQEMFFAKLVAGKDPFDTADDELFQAFAEDHPALQFLMSLPQPWPTVTGDEPEDIVPVGGDDFGVSESPLHILGYRVGSTSELSVSARRRILSQCFESKELAFSEDSDDAYIAKWGRGGGAQRLYRIAVHIKSLADGRVGKDYRKPRARMDWISDLKWLKEKYFRDYKTRFSWPGV